MQKIEEKKTSQYIAYIVIEPPQTCTAFESYADLSAQLNSLQLRLKISKITYKTIMKNENIALQPSNGEDKQKQNQYYESWKTLIIQNTHWWDRRLQKSLEQYYHSNKQFDRMLFQYFSPLSQNIFPFFLVKFRDYSLMINNLLLQSNEELVGIPSSSLITAIQLESLDKFLQTRECEIRFYGQDFDKLIDECKKKKLTVCGTPLQLRQSLRQQYSFLEQNPRSFNQQINEITGSNFLFGSLIMKTNKSQQKRGFFYTYWNLELIKKKYQEQVELQHIQCFLIINQKATVHVYFDVVIAQFRRVSFKIELDVQASKNKLSFKEINGNKVFQDGSVIIEKDQEYLHIYWKFFQSPRCYISEKIERDVFMEPLERNWFRCQNFLLTNCMQLNQRSQVLEQSFLRFTVHKDQCNNLDFLYFCEALENFGFLNSYQPSIVIKIQKFADEQNQNDLNCWKQYNGLSYQVIWLAFSAVCGQTKILSFFPSQIFEDLSKVDQNQAIKQIYSLYNKCKRTKQIISTKEFLECIKENNSNISFDDKIKRLIITPSIIRPDYYLTIPQLPITTTHILKRYQLKNKKKKIIPLEQILVYATFQEDHFNRKLKHSYFERPSNFQNNLLWYQYFREIIKSDITLFEKQYRFLGFSHKSLKYQSCYFIEAPYAKPIHNMIFDQLIQKEFQSLDQIRMETILSILDEFFYKLEVSLQLSNIDEQIQKFVQGEQQQNIENQSDEPQQQKEKIMIKITESEEIGMSNYQRKIFMSQGLISKKLLQIINEMIYEDHLDFTTIHFRFKQYKGILNLDPLEREFQFSLDLNNEMRQSSSPFIDRDINFQYQESSDLRFELKEEFQIIKIAFYKSCYLEYYQILNLISHGENLENKSLKNQLTKYIKCLLKAYQKHNQIKKQQQNNQLFQTLGAKKDQDEEEEINEEKYLEEYYLRVLSRDDKKLEQSLSKVHQNSNEINSIKDFLLPIEQGAYLMGVQDEILNEDEIFLKISPQNQFANAQIIRSEDALVFKKYDLLSSGMRKFKIVTDQQKINTLDQKYLNVIVFSTKVDCSKFSYNFMDTNQRFAVIWDKNIIPYIQSTLFENNDELYYQFEQKNDSQEMISNQSLLLPSPQKVNEIVNYSTNLASDFFCFFQGSQNEEEIKVAYIKLLQIYNILLIPQNYLRIKNKKEFQIEDFDKFFISLKYAYLKYLWFPETQGQNYELDHQIRRDLLDIFRSNINQTMLSFKDCLQTLFGIKLMQ